ncbi:hypothetical protein BN871_IR_00040 [Paenibacillus sp. P22]|nr:hypothetical protein BN871_IR_00040 [Paenibacillus sp. P22]
MQSLRRFRQPSIIIGGWGKETARKGTWFPFSRSFPYVRLRDRYWPAAANRERKAPGTKAFEGIGTDRPLTGDACDDMMS